MAVGSRNPRVLWTFAPRGSMCVDLSSAGPLVIVESADDYDGPYFVEALDPDSGDVVWQRSVEGNESSSLTVQSLENVVLVRTAWETHFTDMGYVGNEGASILEAMDLETGSLLWSREGPESYFDSDISSIGHDRLVVRQGESVAMMDGVSGKTGWTQDTAGVGEYAYRDSTVFVPSPNELVAREAHTGEVLWTSGLGRFDGSMYSNEQTIRGRVKWRFDMEQKYGEYGFGEYRVERCAFTDGLIFLTSDRNVLWAFDVATGQSPWHLSMETLPFFQAIAAFSNNVYLAQEKTSLSMQDNPLYCLRSHDGSTAWTCTSPLWVRRAAALVQGHVSPQEGPNLITSQRQVDPSQAISALHPETGEFLWGFMDSARVSVQFVSDRTVLLELASGWFVAVDLESGVERFRLKRPVNRFHPKQWGDQPPYDGAVPIEQLSGRFLVSRGVVVTMVDEGTIVATAEDTGETMAVVTDAGPVEKLHLLGNRVFATADGKVSAIELGDVWS